jgi:hypothetical protein
MMVHAARVVKPKSAKIEGSQTTITKVIAHNSTSYQLYYRHDEILHHRR